MDRLLSYCDDYGIIVHVHDNILCKRNLMTDKTSSLSLVTDIQCKSTACIYGSIKKVKKIAR